MDRKLSKDLATIREWIKSRHDQPVDVSYDADLIENRLIDSLQFAEFLFLIEEITGTEIDLAVIDLQTFRSLRSIEAHFLRGAEAHAQG